MEGVAESCPNKKAKAWNKRLVSIMGHLTGMDKVDYSALIVLARRAHQTTDMAQQQTRLQQFMDQSGVFLQKHPASEAQFSVAAFGIMGYDIFRDSQYAPLPVEFDPVGGIGRKLDCTRFCPETGHYISNWTSSLKLRQQ